MKAYCKSCKDIMESNHGNYVKCKCGESGLDAYDDGVLCRLIGDAELYNKANKVKTAKRKNPKPCPWCGNKRGECVDCRG